MTDYYGIQLASGHLTVSAESKAPYADDVLDSLRADAQEVMARYPQKRSALLPLLHLVQSVDGYVTGRGIDLCAELLDLSTAEVSGVATFYTQYKRHPNGEFTVGVCTNTLCAIMGGDRIWDEVSAHLGIGHDETTADGKITLERVECNAACDFAPVVMANWEFFDNQTPESTKQLVDDLTAGKDVRPTRGPDTVCTFKQMSRTLAGFGDGLADQGVGAGPASLVGLELAKANGWTAPGETPDQAPADGADDAPADQAPAAPAAEADEPDVVPHDTAAPAPTEDKEQTAKEVADPHKPVEASEQPRAHADEASGPATDPVPVQGTPAIVADIDTAHVDQPAAAQTAVAGTPPPATPGPDATSATVVPDAVAADSVDRPASPPPAPPPPSPSPAPSHDADVDEATVARIKKVASGAAGSPAYEATQDQTAAGAPDRAADRGSHDDAGHGEGSAKPAPDGSGPVGWDVKGHIGSMIFHTPESPWYKRTKAEVWFRDAAAAALAGFADALDRHRERNDDQQSDGKGES